jgi:hypothetical protein
MLKRLFIFTFFLIQFPFQIYAQKSGTPTQKYFTFLNNFETDSLAKLLTNDFQLKRTFTSFKNDKSYFLQTYLPYSKTIHGKFTIIEGWVDTIPNSFLVKDYSDYLKYLGVTYPTWKLIITEKGNQIREVIIDTTDVYRKYLQELKAKEKIFTNWVLKKYPAETEDKLYASNKRRLMFLKEFAKRTK